MANTRTGTRRANGSGTITYDAKRKRYDVRVTVDGKRRKVSAATQAEAWRRAKELKSGAEVKGLPKNPTVAEWLDYWLSEVVPGTVKQTTLDSYIWLADNYVKKTIGRQRLVELTPVHVRAMLKQLEKGLDGGRSLSPNSRRLALAVLRRSLKVAERDGLVERNVAALVDGVRLDRQRGRSLTPQQAQALMAEITASDKLTAALLTLLISTGMRKGEALGLRWIDVDSAARTVRIRRMLSRAPKRAGAGGGLYLAESTKTSGSDRVVEIDEIALSALRRWKVVQAEERLALAAGMRWGFAYLEPSQPPDKEKLVVEDLVFTEWRGSALDPSRPNELLAKLTEKLGLGHWHPHELRHSAASLMIGAGVALPTVSRVLGHSSISVTIDVYGHLVSGEKKAAATALAGVLTGGRTEASGS